MYAAAVGRRRFFTSYEGFLTAGMTNTETPPYYGISISASVNTRYVVSCGPLWCAVRPYQVGGLYTVWRHSYRGVKTPKYRLTVFRISASM